MSKVRVLVNAIPMTYMNTGIGRYLRELYTELERRFGHALDIRYFDGREAREAMPSPPGDASGWSRAARWFWKLPPHAALCVRLARHAACELRFRRVARWADIYHEASFFPFVAPPGVRTVFTVHDMSLERHPEQHPRERVLFHRLMFHRRLGRVRTFLTVSEFTKRELVELAGILPQRIVPIPLAHNAALFHPRSREEVGQAMARSGLAGDYFLFVGGGDPRKNLVLVPPALAKAAPEAILAVTGWPGWTRESNFPDRVRFLGHVSDQDLAALYTGARALVFPSEYEGFGLPVLEALACGCPVVAARRASLPEAGGPAAIYVDDPSDSEALARAMASCLAPEVRTALASKAAEHCAAFSWKLTAERTCEQFLRALE